ncbi:MAG TPA: diacylglycerol kinase family protein [Blastocatellia bacterium]|nr:diacylglycerol kinase family protein [Blastocatellia bacterium]
MTPRSHGLNCLFIVNPASARGTTLGLWSRLRHEISALGIAFDEHLTSGPGEAAEIASRAFSRGVERVIAVGGDGTLSEIVNGYFDEQGRALNPDAAIGLLPSGTGSDFRRSLGMKHHSSFISDLLESEARPVDAACAEFQDFNAKRAKRFFINVASFGLGGDVSASVNRWRNSLPRWIGGRARFSAAALAALGRYKNVRVSMRLDDDRELQISSNLIVVANGKFAGGGMMLAPDAELDDGLLDVIVTDEATRWDVIKELPRIQRGGHLKNPKVTALRARRVSINSEEPMAVDLDGETVGHTPVRITLLPASIRFAGF